MGSLLFLQRASFILFGIFGNTYYLRDMTAKQPRVPKTYKVNNLDYTKAKKKCNKQETTLSNVLERVVNAIARDKTIMWIENKHTVVQVIGGEVTIHDVKMVFQ